MTQAVARGWSCWGKQIFNDEGCYGCHPLGQTARHSWLKSGGLSSAPHHRRWRRPS